MCGSCKIVNISWPLFATLVIGRNVLTQKYTLSKWSLNTFSFVNSLFVDLCTLCVKMKTFLCEESVLRHNKRNCFPSYLDHYLIDFYLCNRPEEMFGRELNLRNILVFVDFWSCVRTENFFLSCARPEEVFAREK